jgi:hypothetical protein
MSYSISVIGRDKEKLKAAIRDQECKDEEKNPHGGRAQARGGPSVR